MSLEEALARFARGDHAGAREAVRRGFRGAQLRALLIATRGAIDGRSPETAELVFALAMRTELGSLPRLDRAMRDARIANQIGADPIGPLEPEILAELPGIAPVLSAHRSGFLREAAVAALGRSREPVVGAFLALRLRDYVEPVRSAALRALESRAVPVEALPALRYLESIHRGAFASPLARAIPESQLRAATGHPDRAARRAAFDELIDRGRVDLELLGGMLEDLDPRVRRRAAALALRDEGELADALLPRLELDRTPAIRVRAVRFRAARGDPDDHGPLLRACFDPHREVRHQARLGLARRGAATDLRARAQRILASLDATDDDRVGALAVLADLGRAEDRAQVRPFAQRRGRVGREADRTLSILDTL